MSSSRQFLPVAASAAALLVGLPFRTRSRRLSMNVAGHTPESGRRRGLLLWPVVVGMATGGIGKAWGQCEHAQLLDLGGGGAISPQKGRQNGVLAIAAHHLQVRRAGAPEHGAA